MTETQLPRPVCEHFDDQVVRIVESQEQVATTRIVANLEEQDLLESMIEQSKPGTIESGLHYLLSTPFRYPPLRYGSRFGSRLEPSLFYASIEPETCLQECAYYRFLFWHDMEFEPPRPIETQHTVFSVNLKTIACVNLNKSPFDEYRQSLRSPASYDFTHKVGAHLRSCEVEMLLFESARGPGSNVALYTPAAFASKPCDQELWNSQLVADRVYFRGPKGVFVFRLSQFADQSGGLPRVAA